MKTQHAAGLAGLALVALAPTAHAVSITKEDVTLDITGIVNGYFVYRTSEVPGSPKISNSGVSNGLLPGWVNFVFTTKAGGLDLKAHIGLAPGINDSSSIIGLPSTVGNGAGAIPGATSPYSQIDTRANYLSFGNASMGTIKLGRDIGIFGTQVILSDMTLLGVGGTSNAAQPFNTTFGMIGHGYMYTGFQAQVAYASPTFSGAQFQVGLFQPKQFSGDQTNTPGLQAGVTFGAGPAKLWGSVVSQKTECRSAPCASGAGYTANGFELGGKVGLGAAELLAYGFSAKGLGLSTVGAQFFGGADAAGNKTKSDGYLLQATYKLGDTKLGVNYGENRDKNGLLGSGNQQKNKSYTLGVYHSLNKYLTLTGEFNNEKKPGVVFLGEKVNTFSLGAIAFF